jgi:ATP-dependent DNA helicase RecQ
MTPEERLNIEEAFRYGEITIVVATKAFGLGIDKPDIAAIVHLEMPASVEEYVQETGRAARGAVDGTGPAVGHCVLIRAPRDCSIHRAFIRSAAPDLPIVQAVWEIVGSSQSTLMPLDELAQRIGDAETDEEAVALSLHYLVEDGAIVREADVMWSGRVWLPPDIGVVLDEAERHDALFATRGRELVAKIARIGSEEYDARTWSSHFGIEPSELERALLELNRRDVIGLAAWRFAIQLRRTTVIVPRWDTIKARCDARLTTVSELSKAAKSYAKQDRDCRRAQLLKYLGIDAPERCRRCDICDPGLPRPWQSGSLKRESIQAALPADAVVRAMLYDAGGRFSQRSIKHALAGSNGGNFPISQHLKEHRLFGYLAALEVAGVESVVTRLLERGEVEEITISRHGGSSFQSWRLTPAGSALA